MCVCGVHCWRAHSIALFHCRPWDFSRCRLDWIGSDLREQEEGEQRRIKQTL